MSKVLSLKLREDIYAETEKITKRMHVPRNAYINTAVAFYNKLKKRAMLKKEISNESQMVKDNSMEVLRTFETLEDEIE